jgi:hypothetical protein
MPEVFRIKVSAISKTKRTGPGRAGNPSQLMHQDQPPCFKAPKSYHMELGIQNSDSPLPIPNGPDHYADANAKEGETHEITPLLGKGDPKSRSLGECRSAHATVNRGRTFGLRLALRRQT